MSNDNFHTNDTPDEHGEIVEKSKSQLKREMTALQKVGEQLVKLPAARLEQVPLDETLREAISVARRIKSREGLRRQLQYIGKLMRTADTEAITAKLDFFNREGEAYRRHFHHIEQWRDRLLAEGDAAIAELMMEARQVDRQHVRQLVRQAQKEISLNKPPAASRKLFKYLREVIEHCEH